MRFWVFWTLLLVGFGVACAKKPAYDAYPYPPPPPPPPPGSSMDEDYGRSMEVEVASVSKSSSRPSRSQGAKGDRGGAPAPVTAAAPADATTPQEPEAPAESSPAEAPKRMIHYNGYANLKVARPELLLAEVQKLAESIGGHVERLDPSQITVQVPVATFDEAFAAVLKMGDVLQKSVTAEDITDAFMAVGLRLKTATTTRDRLVELLASAKDENEKLALLAQIRRLTEEIDVMQSQLRTLATLGDFSRITVVATPRPAFSERTDQNDPVGFAWISQLSPFRRDVGQAGKLLKLPVPEGLVALDDEKHFSAESADAAALWTGTLKNEPAGDAAFWISAVKQRLAPGFASAEVTTVGGYQLLRLVSATNPAYRYLVGVHVDGDDLNLVEIYYPSAAQEERYSKAVLAALGGGAS